MLYFFFLLVLFLLVFMIEFGNLYCLVCFFLSFLHKSHTLIEYSCWWHDMIDLHFTTTATHHLYLQPISPITSLSLLALQISQHTCHNFNFFHRLSCYYVITTDYIALASPPFPIYTSQISKLQNFINVG